MTAQRAFSQHCASESDGEDNGQSHLLPATALADRSNFASAILKSADLMEPRSVVEGGNGEWEIHGIIGEGVTEGTYILLRGLGTNNDANR